jgi:hypothetical protein
MLTGLLPRLLPEGTTVRYVVFEGKQDLEKQLVRRLRGYQKPGARFVILRDQDAADCQGVKNGLLTKCREAGKKKFLVRIACHELESWYLADLAAVELGLDVDGLAVQQEKKKFRNPDLLANAADELMELTAYRYQKIGGSRAIGPHLTIDNGRSRSFSVFVAGVMKMASKN